MRKAIAEHRTRTVPLGVLLKAAAAVDTTGAVSLGWRERILAVITYLVDQGEISASRTKFDRTSTPALPEFITASAGIAPSRRSRPATPVWHADLSWAAVLNDQGVLSSAQIEFLRAVNSWLPSRRGLSVPLRERSLEILGDEKGLELWVPGPLFGPGRLSLDLLQTYLCWPQVERVNLGAGDWLFVENYTTYHSLGRRATELGFDGQIIWGAGNGVSTRLAALALEAHRPPRIFYFGDIDIAGVRIARSTVNRAQELGFASVAAASGLYQLTVTHGHAIAREKERRHPGVLDWAQSWIGGATGSAVREVLAGGRQIVQETVGRQLLGNTTGDDWF